MINCYHCGDPCLDVEIKDCEKSFCCYGCKTVFNILHENDLTYYYDLEKNPGISPKEIAGRYDFLENTTIVEKLLEFNDCSTHLVFFFIPSIHYSSCISILKNLNKLNSVVKSSKVNFPENTVRITFSTEEISLNNIVILLSKIGYEPYISLKDSEKK